MEDEIIKLMSEQNTEYTLGHLECYEPGGEQYNHLKTHQFGTNIQSKVFQEAFMPSTVTRQDGYDLITMFHVHYYWTTAELRQSVMSKVFNLLNSGGVVFILMLEEGDNHQISLRRATKELLKFNKAREYQSVTLYGRKVATEEINLVAKELEITAHEPTEYNITIDLDLSDLSHQSQTSELLSYIISVDFDTFPDSLKAFVVDWIKNHGSLIKEPQTFQLTQTVTSLLYTKSLK